LGDALLYLMGVSYIRSIRKCSPRGASDVLPEKNGEADL